MTTFQEQSPCCRFQQREVSEWERESPETRSGPYRYSWSSDRPMRYQWMHPKLEGLRVWRRAAAEVAKGSRSRAGSNIVEALNGAGGLLTLQDDWDEQGSSGYTKQTFQGTENFLKGLSFVAARAFQRVLPAPEVLPGPDGSLDLRWKSDGSELLINFPKSAAESPTFYGDVMGESCIRGKLDSPRAMAAVIAWLID